MELEGELNWFTCHQEIWRETLTQSGLSVEGRPRGGGDPRVAYRSRAVLDNVCSKMICGKGESDLWRLQNDLAP